MTSPVLLTHAFDARASQPNCYDVDGCNQSGTLTGLRSSESLSWSHRCHRLTPPGIFVSKFNFYDEDCYDQIAVSEIQTIMNSCAEPSWSHWCYSPVLRIDNQ